MRSTRAFFFPALDLRVALKVYGRLMGDAKRIDARTGAGVVGVSAVACAACCAGPILGFLDAVGLTAAVGAGLFGVGGLVGGFLAGGGLTAAAGAVLFGVVGVVAVLVAGLVWWRRRRARRCLPVTDEPVAVAAPRLRSPTWPVRPAGPGQRCR